MREQDTQANDILMFLTLREGPWTIHIHGPHTAEGQRHIRLSRKKLRGEYSWNIDGTRHDSHRFPETEKSITAAKKIAAKCLGVDPGILRFLVAEPITRVDVCIKAHGGRAKNELLAGLFLLHCPNDAILIVCGNDDKPDVHFMIVRIGTSQQEAGSDS